MSKINSLYNSFNLHSYLYDVYYHNFACRTHYSIVCVNPDYGFDHNQFYLEF